MGKVTDNMITIGGLQSFLKMSIVLGLGLFLFACSKPYVQGQGLEKGHPISLAVDDYQIGSGDVLEIQVWRNEALSKVEVVRPDGKISLPLMGELRVAGLTALQLRERIIDELKKFGETPEATVIVREINSYIIYVLGEVQHPGKFQLNRRTTLVQAIAMAEGFTTFASRNKISLLRKVDGEDRELKFTVDYNSIVSGEERNIWLQSGDTVIVP